MGDLGLPVTLEGVLVGLLSEVERVEESHGGEGTGHVVDGERVDARGDASGLGRGEGGGGADEGEGGGGLEHDEEIDGVELTRQLKLCEDSVEREALDRLRLVVTILLARGVVPACPAVLLYTTRTASRQAHRRRVVRVLSQQSSLIPHGLACLEVGKRSLFSWLKNVVSATLTYESAHKLIISGFQVELLVGKSKQICTCKVHSKNMTWMTTKATPPAQPSNTRSGEPTKVTGIDSVHAWS